METSTATTHWLPIVWKSFTGRISQGTRGTRAPRKELIARRRAADSRVIHLACTMHIRTRIFLDYSVRALDFIWVMSASADYVPTGQYIRIDNSTIPHDVCLSLFASLQPLSNAFFHPVVCFAVNRLGWKTFRTLVSLSVGSWRTISRNYFSLRRLSIFSPLSANYFVIRYLMAIIYR